MRTPPQVPSSSGATQMRKGGVKVVVGVELGRCAACRCRKRVVGAGCHGRLVVAADGGGGQRVRHGAAGGGRGSVAGLVRCVASGRSECVGTVAGSGSNRWQAGVGSTSSSRMTAAAVVRSRGKPRQPTAGSRNTVGSGRVRGTNHMSQEREPVAATGGCYRRVGHRAAAWHVVAGRQ